MDQKCDSAPRGNGWGGGGGGTKCETNYNAAAETLSRRRAPVALTAALREAGMESRGLMKFSYRSLDLPSTLMK